MDILYITRSKNTVIGWNNNQSIYTKEFKTLETAKQAKKSLENYLKYYGSIPDRYLKYIDGKYI